jgi:hypothetical protein
MFNSLIITVEVLDMKDVHQRPINNTKEENFLVWAYVYLAVGKFYKLPNP